MYKIKLSDINKDMDFYKFDLSEDSSLYYDSKRVVFIDDAICVDVDEESQSILYSEYFQVNIESYKNLITRIVDQKYDGRLPKKTDYHKLINCDDMSIKSTFNCKFFDKDGNLVEKSNLLNKEYFKCKVVYNLTPRFSPYLEILVVIHQIKIEDNLPLPNRINMFVEDEVQVQVQVQDEGVCL